jgi:hypothetical protein
VKDLGRELELSPDAGMHRVAADAVGALRRKRR